MKKILAFALLVLMPFTAQAKPISAQAAKFITEKSILPPGDYYWNNGETVDGPVRIEINLSTQMAYVWKGSTVLGVTNVSSGRETFETPQGVFKILGKEDNHHSQKYDADMPWTMWLNNDGVALHSGGTPGRPSSHGCIHLPAAFAELLYQATKTGTVVKITNNNPANGFLLDL